MQLPLGHGGRLAQVEEGTPTTHRRLLGFNRRPFPVRQGTFRLTNLHENLNDKSLEITDKTISHINIFEFLCPIILFKISASM